MGSRSVALAGVAAVAVTLVLDSDVRPADIGGWLRLLFVACWLAAAAAVAHLGEPGVVTGVAVAFLVSFPVSFSGLSGGLPVLDQAWRTLGSISVLAFLYLFPRGHFEPRWTGPMLVVSAAYLAARAWFPDLAAWSGDLVVFPLTIAIPLGVQVMRYLSASNSTDRRRLRIVGAACGIALLGQLVLFALLITDWLGPRAAAESWVEPIAYALALLLPAALVLALAPVGGGGRRLVDARLGGREDDALSLITPLGALARGAVTSRELLPLAAEAVRRSLRLRAVWIDLGEAESPTANDPQSSPLATWPVIHAGVTVGSLRVVPRSGRPGLSSGDRQTLTDLATRLGPIVGSAQLTAQLEEARTRLLGVREEERRRLRAELHDELGATLAGLTLKTGLAESVLEQDPATARRLLREIESNLQTTVRRVRELVEGLRPAHLDELGLDAAIRELGLQLRGSGSPLDICVQCRTDPGLPAAVELAAYRIAQEALTNAVRHSGGSRVDVALAVDESRHQLEVRVADDGIGLREARALGFGVQAMRQRAREVGGECTLHDGEPRGLVVTATLPLPTEVSGD